jgi:uncharacterized protein (DUF2141 family)
MHPTSPLLPSPATAATAWLVGALTLGHAAAAELTLSIEPVSELRGTVQVAVFASEAQFRKEAVRALRLPATASSLTAKLTDLPPGDYAITVFHDRNGNDRLDTNLLGMPREPWGASSGQKPLAGPPSWADTRFVLPATGTHVRIRLNE